ncbi:MAG: TonB-dependent receptor [Candidatus Solibacter usitatus]|nr:TonB-dependent receptor [Candidatus Solibacter usitatus]
MIPIPLLAVVLCLHAADKSEKSAKPAAPVDTPKPITLAASQRNENVAVQLIDTEEVKAANVRLGVNYSIVPQPPVETSAYSSEHGRPARELFVLRRAQPFNGLHLELFENLRNSIFNTRTFFQVGPVKPSRENQYGARFTGHLGWLGDVTANFSRHKVQGMVNGNVLVPLETERAPLSTDPAVRALIQRFLNAYPKELPNRLDFDPRALNTNAPQSIAELSGNLRLDRSITEKGRLMLFQDVQRRQVDAFQLVAGQNPDMSIHNFRSRATFQYALAPQTDLSFGGGFTRVVSLLTPEPNAVGPRVRMGFQIAELGPDSQFPIDRTQNGYRWGVLGSHRAGGGRHALTFGADGARLQLNGIEVNNSRGLIWFTSDRERTAIQNFLYGSVSTYEVTVGEMSRGFRNWSANAFFADQWRVNSRLQLYIGLRYSAETSPYEVNHKNDIPYGCDCNNFSPRFHIAYNAPRGWVLRTGYTVSFDQIPPVTYQQVRYNAPLAHYLQVQSPSLLDPLRGINVNDPNVRSSPTHFATDLVSPYAHQYNLTLENKLGPARVRVGYFGSRSIKLVNMFIENRGEPIPGMTITTANVDARRADARYYDVKTVLSAGIAYLDGGQASLDLAPWKGVSAGLTYMFSKALDEGVDFTSTAANGDVTKGRAQSAYESLKDRKGLSNFDSTHSLLIHQMVELPKLAGAHSLLRTALGGWQWSSSALLRSGTPLTLYVGSDAPGFGNVDGGPSDRPNILDTSILGKTISNPDTATHILSREKFGYIQPGQRRGSLGRNVFRKGGIANWNAAMTRRWRLGASEKWVQFRAESFNLGNHPQFDEPNRNLNASVFGKITNTLNDGRIFQLGLRIIL